MRLLTIGVGLCLIWASSVGFGSAQAACISPDEAVTDSSFKWGGYTLGLNACVNKGETIECSFVFTIDNDSDRDWDYKTSNWFTTMKLIDNFEIEHPQVRGYFENGRCESQETVNLAKGDKVWIVQEFGGAKDDITRARIVFPALSSSVLNGPVSNGNLPGAASQK